MNETPSPSAPRFFQPFTLLAGVALGLAALAWAGRAVTRHSWYRDFARFHPLITAEAQYQPTVAEMQAIVRARCRPDQILVVIGGNSIFQGVGQPVEKLWTRHLQELLGDRYAVVNLAFRGSSPTDGGALVAESLRDEFPRQIYLANVLPFNGVDPAGSHEYRYMLFDAYYKGWLLDFAPRRQAIEQYVRTHPAMAEPGLGGRLDAWLRFHEFWNWWSFTRGFTFPTPRTPEATRAFRARGLFPDTELDFDDIPFQNRFAPRFRDAEMAITRGTTATFYDRAADGGWILKSLEQQQLRRMALAAFPEWLRVRTLMVHSRNSPYYTRQLTDEERARDELGFRDSMAIWREAGYAATEYGADFEDTDFGDRTHLTTRGGRKLAARLAPPIQQLAARLGYPGK